MLSSVLRSALAIRVNIQIMRAFVTLRHVLESHGDLADKLDGARRTKYDRKFAVVFEAIRKLMTPPRAARRPHRFQGVVTTGSSMKLAWPGA